VAPESSEEKDNLHVQVKWLPDALWIPPALNAHFCYLSRVLWVSHPRNGKDSLDDKEAKKKTKKKRKRKKKKKKKRKKKTKKKKKKRKKKMKKKTKTKKKKRKKKTNLFPFSRFFLPRYFFFLHLTSPSLLSLAFHDVV
jgi:outer membrane biosynthesis protein TonB